MDQIAKSHQTINLKKNRQIGGSYIHFEYEAYAMTGNGTETYLQKNREITSRKLIFVGFKPFETTVGRTKARLFILLFPYSVSDFAMI